MGAAITTLITEVLLFTLLYINVRKSIPILSISQLGYKPILAIISMGLSLYLLAKFNSILVLTIGLLFYLMVLLFTKAVRADKLFKLRTLVKFG